MTVTALIEAWKSRQYQDKLSFSLPGDFGVSFEGAGPKQEASNPRLLFGLDTIVLNPSLADALQMPGQTGLLVIDVTKQMPADRAGIQPGDVIVEFDGQPIVDALSFASYLQLHNLGSHPQLKILRKGIERTVAVQIP